MALSSDETVIDWLTLANSPKETLIIIDLLTLDYILGENEAQDFICITELMTPENDWENLVCAISTHFLPQTQRRGEYEGCRGGREEEEGRKRGGRGVRVEREDGKD